MDTHRVRLERRDRSIRVRLGRTDRAMLIEVAAATGRDMSETLRALVREAHRDLYRDEGGRRRAL